MPEDTPANLLADAGRALYGREWQSPLADALGVNRLTLRRWLTGHTPLPASHGVFADLRLLMAQRVREIEAARARLP